ncbi:MAG: cysteine desulfurase-like protein [Gammaproteobacteria bacterium]|nr:cysteine desulfurase-like protein [Gammaproteobacteria bacterium]MBU2675711.1 cysteine desulfurase-like protein [Gammaproteobacteria bacterium]NNC56880.1 cysteine desulfurase-like protein [Woeseiaceae bacterium]NNL49449.1 cysteine desulfurase-like protein [Woeseiaceae bacterium]
MSLDLELLRSQFPALSISDNGVRRIYLDNPAGTQVPSRVAAAMSDCLLKSNANLGGFFASSVDAGRMIDSARARMADFLNAPSNDEIIFGQNMTTITMHMSRSIGRLFEPGDEIVLSRMDHDANVWPWVLLARDLDLTIKWLPFNKETFEFDLEVLDDLLTDKTRLLCVGGASNLTGTTNDIAAICAKARDAGVLTYIDAVQSAPHIATDVQAIGCDFLVCSAYKFFGPHQGILWGRSAVLETLEAYKVRPAPERIPDRFETGTQSNEDFAGVAAAIDYIAWIGDTMAKDYMADRSQLSARRQRLHAAMDLLFDYECSLAEHLIDGLLQLDGVTVQGITAKEAMSRRVPTVAFTHGSVAPADIAKSLAERNIFVWSGHNYAVEVAKTLGIYETGGAVRIGPVHYNSHDEIDEALAALATIVA